MTRPTTSRRIGRLDVLALLDRERVVGAGVEEVEAEGGHQRGDRPAQAASDQRAHQHGEDQDQGHRDLRDLRPEARQRGGDGDGEHAADAGAEPGVQLQSTAFP